MNYILGIVFLLLSVWQLAMTKRSFTDLKKNGNKNTSPFIMLGLWFSFIIGISFLAAAGYAFFY
ncbi:hypothetical protein IGI39_000815 [Enterococcus sp. AZ135]|uniref:hypothetical protein n=1 Tax=unclassified Enterococcus TaxID=2608891 RepID=UPI003F20F995